MSLTKDKEDIKFENLLAEKRHQEIKTLLASLVKNMASNSFDEVKELFRVNADTINLFLEKIKEIEKPEVNIQTNQDKVISSLELMTSQILKSLDEVKEILNKPEKEKEDMVCSIERGYTGEIEKMYVRTIKSK